jgi:hypothetical protein
VRRLLFFISLTLLTACSSNQKKGDNMMEAEQYDQAVFFYEKAYQESPDDEEVVEKLSFARSRLVGANLIEVRMFRQSNLQVKAAKKLNESLDQMTRWKIRADSAVKATIDEEVEFSAKWLNKELPRLAKDNNYNRFAYSLKQYKHIIDAGYNERAIKKLQPAMNRLGLKQCREMKSDLGPYSYYYFDHWQAYCTNFGMSIETESRKTLLKKDPTRFTQANISSTRLALSNNTGINRQYFKQTLEQELNTHPWFSAHAKNSLRLTLQGKINYKKRTSTHTFSFTYPAKKEVYEVIRDKKNPKIIKRKLLNSIPTEETVNIKGQSHLETVSHNLNLKGKLHQYTITGTELAADKRHQTYAHQGYFDKKKVRPLKPNFMNKSHWFSTIGKKMMPLVKKDLDKAWVDSFCQGESRFKLAKYEQAARCAELKPRHPTVENWSRDQFGLKYEELEILLN